MQDDDLQMLQTFMTKNEWPPNLSKADQIYFKTLAEKAFQDKNKVVWVRLSDINYPRTALYLPSRYEAHNGEHNATHKTYLKISTSDFWPKMTLKNTRISAFNASNERSPQTNRH